MRWSNADAVTDGALMRDTRMVERKKTGKAKARKKVSVYPWSFLPARIEADEMNSTLGSSDSSVVATRPIDTEQATMHAPLRNAQQKHPQSLHHH